MNLKNLKYSILIFFLTQGIYAKSFFLEENVNEKKDTTHLAENSTYTNINGKSWDQILMENTFHWQPPYTVHLPVQPVHSPDWVHVDRALNVYRRYVTPNVRVPGGPTREDATTQETWIVQFAFENPAVVPDFHLSTLSLADNRYPIVTGDYYSRDMYYQIEYKVSPVSEDQSLLWIDISVTNEEENTHQAHVRAKVNFQRENDLFNYHYIPFYWDASRWLPCDIVSLDNNTILKDGKIFGKVVPGSMEVDWEDSAYFQDKDYNVNLRTTRMSGFVQPHMRLKNIQDVIHAQVELEPGETKTFSLALLVNYKNITKSDLSHLEKSSSKRVREEALSHFKDQFTYENTEMLFGIENWQDVLTELQISILQLLVKHPGRESLMPSQGGSSERFYVWVWEAVHMLRPMLRLGHFEPVKKGLDFIFRLQDAGVPPVGRFTTTEGSIGTTGPRWANSTGSALGLASDYYLYSNDSDFLDEYLSKILRASRWIVGELRATRKLNPDGTRPLYYGLMPFAVATDGDEGYVVSATDAYTFWGLEKTVRLLERIKHDEAAEFRHELELYRNDLSSTIKGLSHANGFIDRKILTDDKETRSARKFENVSCMARISQAGIVNPESNVFQSFITYFENNKASDYFMGEMDREITYIGSPEFFWQHIYLSTGQWKKAFAATQTNFKYGMTQDTYQTQERFSRRDPAFTCWQPNGSGNGRMIDMMLNSLYFESDKGVTLLGGMPFAWLQANQITSLRNLYTSAGKINLEIETAGPKTFIVTLSSADKNFLPRTIRFPEYLNAKATESLVKNKGKGYFEITGAQNKLVFLLSKEL